MSKYSLLLAAVLMLWASSDVHGQGEAATCPVTVLRTGEWAYGDKYIAAVLAGWPSGMLEFHQGGPGLMLPDGSLHMMLAWRRGVYGTPLTISGKRLDASASALRARISHSDDIGGESSTVIFPTPGCWQVTGKIGDHEVTFVVLVRIASE